MRVLVIRHAIAMDKDEFHRINTDDGLRPLTSSGMKKMKKNAEGLQRLVPKIDVFISSPLVRAVQTAEIVSIAYKGLAFRKRPELLPDHDPQDLMEWLKNLPNDFAQAEGPVIAFVGHEPHLTQTVSYFLTRRYESVFELRKGGACLLEFSKNLDAGKARLLWLMKPSQLRRLGH